VENVEEKRKQLIEYGGSTVDQLVDADISGMMLKKSEFHTGTSSI